MADTESDIEAVRLVESDMLRDCDGLNDRLVVADEPTVAELETENEGDEEADAEDVLENERDIERVELADAEYPTDGVADGVEACVKV